MIYKFIAKGDAQEFEDAINEATKEGFLLEGNHSSSCSMITGPNFMFIYTQLMVKI